MRDFVYVEHQHYVSVRGSSFRFVDLISKQETYIPFDDVEWLIFDNERSYFSKRMVTVCMEKNIGILFCDKKHSPLTLLISDFGHSQKVNRLKQQIALNKKTKDRLWRKIIVGKINNQSDCMLYMTQQNQMALTIQLIGKQVVEGDKTHRESYASRIYFPNLFGKEFKRGRFKDPINSGLNYGYALLRASIRRELAFYGLEPSLGIKHDSSENPFNLSDDIIEPFRPFVDAYVYEFIYSEKIEEFELTEKQRLLKVFLKDVLLMEKYID